MSTTKHTPGPWHVRTIDLSLGSIDAASGVQVAQSQEVSVKDRNTGHHERKANARLIAAAPDLLDALQEAIQCLGEGHLKRICASAIAKATQSRDAK